MSGASVPFSDSAENNIVWRNIIRSAYIAYKIASSCEELVKTIQDISHKVKKNLISPHSINESVIKEHLYTHDMPDVDLLIRTSGEQRISNFLLWQIAYAELYFTPVLWPDFTRKHLYEAIYNYQKRERRFGKTSEQIN